MNSSRAQGGPLLTHPFVNLIDRWCIKQLHSFIDINISISRSENNQNSQLPKQDTISSLPPMKCNNSRSGAHVMILNWGRLLLNSNWKLKTFCKSHNGFCQKCPTISKSRISMNLENLYNVSVHFKWKNTKERPIFYEK